MNVFELCDALVSARCILLFCIYNSQNVSFQMNLVPVLLAGPLLYAQAIWLYFQP